jgi:hypothetical protein
VESAFIALVGYLSFVTVAAIVIIVLSELLSAAELAAIRSSGSLCAQSTACSLL